MENKKGKKKLDLKKLKITKLNIGTLQQVKGGESDGCQSDERSVCRCTSDLIMCNTTGGSALFFGDNYQ